MTNDRKERTLRNLLGLGTVALLVAFSGFGIAAVGYLEVGRAIGSVAIVTGVSSLIAFGLTKIFIRTQETNDDV